MRDIHTHTTPHAHAGQAPASGGRAEETSPTPLLPAGKPQLGLRVETKTWGQPRPCPTVPRWAQGAGHFRWLERRFLSDASSWLWRAGGQGGG